MGPSSRCEANKTVPTKRTERLIHGLLVPTTILGWNSARELQGAVQRRLVRLRSRLSPQDQRRDQRDDEPNREGIDERQRCVQERVFVHLLVPCHLLKPRLDGCITRARGPELLNQMSTIFVPEIWQEVIVDNFPRHDIADGRNQSNGGPDGKGFQERNLAVADVV